jgi:hypothetical protein
MVMVTMELMVTVLTELGMLLEVAVN